MVGIMNKLYTIGFTQKSAKKFFELLKNNGVQTIIDIRLNNTSQLAGFAKFPDVEFFLEELCTINYIHDIKFAPEEKTLKNYKNKTINWEQYVAEFNNTMKNRHIEEYIQKNYKNYDNICLLCSEPTAEKCHRRLIAEIFQSQYANLQVKHL